MIFSPDVFLTLLKVGGILVALSFVIFWVGLVWWVAQDILSRTKDKVIVAAALAITSILGPVGALFYLIVRPRQTLQERMGDMAEREMMLYASSVSVCHACGHMIQADARVCPYCGIALKKSCQGCQQPLALDWAFCPSCGITQIPATESAITAEEASNLLLDESTPLPTEVNRRRRQPLAQSAWMVVKQTATTIITPVKSQLSPAMPEVIEAQPEDVDDMSEDISNQPTETSADAKKRGRGRPKGSPNKKGSTRRAKH